MEHRPTLRERGSGILLHPTSLPGPYALGDLGPAAHDFARWLAAAGQRWWQMLPVGPTGPGNSPYDSPSSAAGSPLLLSLEALAEDGLLARDDLASPSEIDPTRASYSGARRFRLPRLRRAFAAFRERRGARRELERFAEEQGAWLDGHALYQALEQAHGGRPWTEWPEGLRDRRPAELARARRELAPAVDLHRFLQLQFDRQWRRLRAACHALGIGLIGDVPIYVSHASADVWADPDLFHLDPRTRRPSLMAGTPPDYFTRTGQLWGNPVYRWQRLERTGFAWWIERLRRALARFDALRLDHFIGFLRYWGVAAPARTAEHGSFRPGPGAAFLAQVARELGRVELIAEDLGVVTPEVKRLRDRFRLPGMRVLQFAFGSDPEAEAYQPHSYPRRCVVYTGTHDNDTSVGWFRDAGSAASTRTRGEIAAERAFALRYLHSDGSEVHWDLVRLAWMSVGRTAIAPAQDLLGLGSEARMNRPGERRGNWEWRLRPGALDAALAARLRLLSETYGRAPRARAREEAGAAPSPRARSRPGRRLAAAGG